MSAGIRELRGSDTHTCAVEDTSLCRYLRGIEPLDFVLRACLGAK